MCLRRGSKSLRSMAGKPAARRRRKVAALFAPHGRPKTAHAPMNPFSTACHLPGPGQLGLVRDCTVSYSPRAGPTTLGEQWKADTATPTHGIRRENTGKPDDSPPPGNGSTRESRYLQRRGKGPNFRRHKDMPSPRRKSDPVSTECLSYRCSRVHGGTAPSRH